MSFIKRNPIIFHVFLALLMWSTLVAAVYAGPTLTADPYPGTQAITVSATSNGTALPASACSLVGRVPTCDLSSLAVPGTYTLVMTATSPGGCTSGTNTATCFAAGSASSAPFSLTLSAGAAAPSGLKIAP